VEASDWGKSVQARNRLVATRSCDKVINDEFWLDFDVVAKK
jgi:hypothetical protein